MDDKFDSFKSIRPVGARISSGTELVAPSEAMREFDELVKKVISGPRRSAIMKDFPHSDKSNSWNSRLELEPLQSMKGIDSHADVVGIFGRSATDAEKAILTIRRSAQIQMKDIRHPETIQMILDSSFNLSLFGFVVPLTEEFVTTYLMESEADIKARGTSDETKGTIPLWQPMVDGQPVGEKVSAKLLYVRLGGTLCDEIRLGTPTKGDVFKFP